MIKSNKKFIIKNSSGWTQDCEANDVIQLGIGLPAFTGGKVDITGVVSGVTVIPEVPEVEATENQSGVPAIPEQTVYTQKAYFSVPNDLVYTSGDDILTTASELTVSLLEEWNSNVTFEIMGI